MPAPDPTLGGLGAEPVSAADGFPDTAIGTHLVLYQTDDGAVDLRWRIDPADIAHARAAFAGAEAHAVLRLFHLGGNGDNRLMADAALGSDTEAESGLAHYAGGDAEGLLQAEIGLASADGGWLLIARSNGLPAAAPVEVDFLREQGPASAPVVAAADAAQSGAMAASADAGRSGTVAARDAAEPLRLEPEFPLVAPELSERAASGVVPGAAPERTPTVASGVALASDLDAATDVATGARAPFGAGAAADTTLGRAGYGARLLAGADGQSLSEPPPGGVVPRLTQRPLPRPDQPETQPGPRPAAPQPAQTPVPGSGPLRPAADEATLTAELLVQGSAPPNTLLDLGGHAYRVGPGGRFQLRIPIRDREVIMRVLATLPRLPVAAPADGEVQGLPEE
ncbi:MAG: hypothetical protein LJE69_07275 [Thiohalocapsa sp.]|jgi:hypothetical protein|uniref:hypothetical protein n=1 Tax=Thiohalocapsa sp. TaxID=2497641 RepID=UPI0025F3DE9B|nr:hypothetical protein [Thiohalocapsa sp.]MCG6941036.1 hypothetical protein [Thiohalocapsa sp.]